MAKYTIDDFAVGDKVYHLSNTKVKMVIVKIHQNINISCRWVDNDGKTQVGEFIAEELGKTKDLGPKFSAV